MAAAILLWLTTLLLLANTLRRLRRPIDAGLLVPIAWIVLMPAPIILRGGALGFHGAPRDHLDLAVSMANVAFLGLQFLLDHQAFHRLQQRVVDRFSPPRERLDQAATSPVTRYWLVGLTTVAVALAVLHWALMPKIPALDLIQGIGDPRQLALDRENSAKLLQVPALLKYVFTWNSRILLPILFCAAVVLRRRRLAIFVGVFGLLYIASPLEKFPSMLFTLAPFLAVAVRDQKRLVSRLLVIGAVVSLIPPWVINQSPAVSNSLHHALGITIAGTPAPTVQPTAGATGPAAVQAPPTSFSPGMALSSLGDLVFRRIGTGPADVTYAWFSYFPAVRGGYLNGSGWLPWRVLSSHYQSPANLVGVWAYYGRGPYNIRSITAYASFIADGWAEFGYAGVALATLVLIAFCLVLELMRGFARQPFILACYAPALLLVAATAPIAGLLAMLLSLGLFWSPVIALGYLVSMRTRLGHPSPVLAPSPSRPVPAG